jgi:hypothetical protein
LKSSQPMLTRPLTTQTLAAASSRRLCGLLFALWCIGIWGSPFYIAPTSDDGAYISEAIGVMQFGRVSMLYIDQPAIYSAAFPSYAYISGIFYQIWDAVGLPINFFVYNAFHNLTATLLLAAVVGLLFHTATSRPEGALRANVSLTLLALSPYVIDVAHLRPEPIGLAATIGAILAYESASRARTSGTGLYMLTALLLGLAVTMHPSLTVTSGVTALAALVLLLRRGRVRVALLSAAAGLLVPALVVGWYLANLPQSVDMLFFEVNQRTATLEGIGASLMLILDYILFTVPVGASVAIKAYNAILFGGLALSMIAALTMLLAVLLKRLKAIGDAELLCAAFFVGAFLNTTMDHSGRTQLYVVLSCASVLMVGMLVRRNEVMEDIRAVAVSPTGTVLAGAVACVMALAVLFNPIVHVSKRMILSAPRYHGLTANALVRPALSKGDALFFTTDQFLPPFVDLVKDTYKGEADIAAYWVLPYMHGRPDLERHAVSALTCFLARRHGERIVWGLRKDFVTFDKGSPRRATIRLVTRFRSFRIEFEVEDILYEFHDGYFVAGRVLALTETLDGEGKPVDTMYYRHPGHAPGCEEQAGLKSGAG